MDKDRDTDKGRDDVGKDTDQDEEMIFKRTRISASIWKNRDNDKLQGRDEDKDEGKG